MDDVGRRTDYTISKSRQGRTRGWFRLRSQAGTGHHPAALVLAVGVLAVAACGSSSSSGSATTRSTTNRSPRTSSTTASTVPAARPAPDLTGVTLQFAYQRSEGFKLDSVDLSPQLLGGDHARVQLDTSNWLVLGQCPADGDPVPGGQPIRLGVLKIDEVTPTMRSDSITGAFDQASCSTGSDGRGPRQQRALRRSCPTSCAWTSKRRKTRFSGPACSSRTAPTVRGPVEASSSTPTGLSSARYLHRERRSVKETRT